MMQVFCVLLKGEPFLLREADAGVEYGFYRNEYVLSHSSVTAVALAKARTLKKLKARRYIVIPGRPLVLQVDDIQTGMPFTRLFRNEGFVLFRTDSA